MFLQLSFDNHSHVIHTFVPSRDTCSVEVCSVVVSGAFTDATATAVTTVYLFLQPFCAQAAFCGSGRAPSAALRVLRPCPLIGLIISTSSGVPSTGRQA